jgi:hypothetical protein
MLVSSAPTRPPDRLWSACYVRRTTIVWSLEAACACRPQPCIIRSRHQRLRKTALGAAIAFNTLPDDSADAAARWLAAGNRAVSSGYQQRPCSRDLAGPPRFLTGSNVNLATSAHDSNPAHIGRSHPHPATAEAPPALAPYGVAVLLTYLAAWLQRRPSKGPELRVVALKYTSPPSAGRPACLLVLNPKKFSERNCESVCRQ